MVGPRPHESLDDVGPGVGGEVDVDVSSSRVPGRGRRRARCRRRGSTRGRRRRAGARAAAPATPGRAAAADGAGTRSSAPFSSVGRRDATQSVAGLHGAADDAPSYRPLRARTVLRTRCSRVGCGGPRSRVVLRSTPATCLVWLDPLDPERRAARACSATRHADRSRRRGAGTSRTAAAADPRLWSGRHRAPRTPAPDVAAPAPTRPAGPPRHRRRAPIRCRSRRELDRARAGSSRTCALDARRRSRGRLTHRAGPELDRAARRRARRCSRARSNARAPTSTPAERSPRRVRRRAAAGASPTRCGSSGWRRRTAALEVGPVEREVHLTAARPRARARRRASTSPPR